MKCPKCKQDCAFLWTEDGIPDPGKNTLVDVRCYDCGSEINELTIGYIEIDLTIKRNTFELETDE